VAVTFARLYAERGKRGKHGKKKDDATDGTLQPGEGLGKESSDPTCGCTIYFAKKKKRAG